MNWKQQLKQLKLNWFQKHHPDFYKMSGGERMGLKPYTDATTNGLTNAVYDWLKFSGHYCNRINTTGVARKINGKLQYTGSSTNKGTADIDSIIDGKPVKIEIKNINTKDKVSKQQLQEKARIEAAGGIYIVVPCMEMFVNWYQEFVNNKIIQNGIAERAN